MAVRLKVEAVQPDPEEGRLSEGVGGAGLLVRETGLMRRFFFLLMWEELE